jgi:hypothetical protein
VIEGNLRIRNRGSVSACQANYRITFSQIGPSGFVTTSSCILLVIINIHWFHLDFARESRRLGHERSHRIAWWARILMTHCGSCRLPSNRHPKYYLWWILFGGFYLIVSRIRIPAKLDAQNHEALIRCCWTVQSSQYILARCTYNKRTI